MLGLILAWIWCGVLTEALLRYRTRLITRDPEKRIDLPFKSRILGTDRIEKNPDFYEYRKVRISAYVGCILLTLIAPAVIGPIPLIPDFFLLFVLATIGALVGGLIGFRFIKKQ